jgi:hypothetical protein
MTSATTEIRGIAFRSFFRALETLRGREAVDATRARLSEFVRAKLERGGIEDDGYYPISWYAELHEAAEQALDGGDALAREIGRESTRQDVSTLLTFVLAFVSPNAIFHHADRIWSAYFRASSVVSTRISAHERRLEFRGAGMTRGTWAETLGGTEVLLEICKARSPRVERLEGGGDGDERMVVRCSWDP